MFCAKIKNEMHTTSPGKGLTIFLPFFGGWLYIYIHPKLEIKKVKKYQVLFFNRFSIAKMQAKFNHFPPDFLYI